MFAVKKFRFDVDLGTLFDSAKIIPLVLLEGMELRIPPKGERPNLNHNSSPEKHITSQTWVLIGALAHDIQVAVRNQRQATVRFYRPQVQKLLGEH